MREKMENRLHIEASGVDLRELDNIEFYVRQGACFWEYTPTVISATEMVVIIPFTDAMKLRPGQVRFQLAYTLNGVPDAIEPQFISVGELLKKAGYLP